MLALVSTEVVISVIRDYQVVEKIKVDLPEEINGLVKCTNPKCISNNEPMKGRYHVINKQEGVLKCHYCNRKIEREEIVISE